MATIAAGSAVLADPLQWSYAETHSYVKVNKDSIGVALPDDFDGDIYAKVVYIPDIYALVSGIEIDPLFARVSCGFAKTLEVNSKLDKKQNLITADSKLDYSLISGSGFVTTEYVDSKISSVIGDAPEVLDTLKELADALSGDASFATTITTTLSNKADKSDIPTKVSDLTNDSNLVPLSTVQQMLKEITDTYNAEIAAIKASTNLSLNLNSRLGASLTDNLDLDERLNNNINNIIYGDRR